MLEDALTITETRRLLESLDVRPRKSLGQNFLIDGNIVRKSVELAELKSGETVVEIGPGLGTLTAALLRAGCVVFAVEKDPRLCRYLADELGRKYPHTFSLLEGDAMHHPLAGFRPAAGEPFKIVANLPYAISTP